MREAGFEGQDCVYKISEEHFQRPQLLLALYGNMLVRQFDGEKQVLCR